MRGLLGSRRVARSGATTTRPFGSRHSFFVQALMRWRVGRQMRPGVSTFTFVMRGDLGRVDEMLACPNLPILRAEYVFHVFQMTSKGDVTRRGWSTSVSGWGGSQ
eukprot:5388209-Prymnesium_polylepis.1